MTQTFFLVISVACIVCVGLTSWFLMEARLLRRALIALVVMRDKSVQDGEWTAPMVADRSNGLIPLHDANPALRLLERHTLVDSRQVKRESDGRVVRLYKVRDLCVCGACFGHGETEPDEA